MSLTKNILKSLLIFGALSAESLSASGVSLPSPPNTTTSGSNGQGAGYDALSLAVQNGNVANVQQLLAGGQFKVNAPANDNTTPLGWAIYNNNLPMVEALVAAGADVNALTKGHTPLYWANALTDRYTDALADIDSTSPYDQKALLIDTNAFQAENSIGDFLTAKGAIDDSLQPTASAPAPVSTVSTPAPIAQSAPMYAAQSAPMYAATQPTGYTYPPAAATTPNPYSSAAQYPYGSQSGYSAPYAAPAAQSGYSAYSSPPPSAANSLATPIAEVESVESAVNTVISSQSAPQPVPQYTSQAAVQSGSGYSAYPSPNGSAPAYSPSAPMSGPQAPYGTYSPPATPGYGDPSAGSGYDPNSDPDAYDDGSGDDGSDGYDDGSGN